MNLVTSQREKLASSKHQIDLLTAKLKQLEARIPDLENAAGRGEKDKALSKLQQQVQRLQQELSEAKIANRNLRAKCAEITTLKLVDFREFVTRALGFDTNSMAVPDEKVYHQLKGLVEAQRSRSPKLFHSDSSLQGSSDRNGVRYLGSQPTHSFPSNWGQRRP
ncbi:uncharacterized protein LOC144507351 [Mustelus asterias]